MEDLKKLKSAFFEEGMEGKYLSSFKPKTRHLIGQPAQSANQRLVFWQETALNILAFHPLFKKRKL